MASRFTLLFLAVLLLPYLQPAIASSASSNSSAGLASPRIPDVEKILVGSGVVDADFENDLMLVVGGFGARLYSLNGSLLWSGVESEPACKSALLGEGVVAVFTATGLEEYNTSSGELLWVDPGYGCPSLVDGSSSGVLAVVESTGRGEKSVLELVGLAGSWREKLEIEGRVSKIEWSPSGGMLAVLYEATGSSRRGVLVVLDSKGSRLYESPSNTSVYDFAWSPSSVLAVAMGAHGVLLVDLHAGGRVVGAAKTMLRAYRVAWLNESSIAVVDSLLESCAVIDFSRREAVYGTLPLRGAMSTARMWSASSGDFIIAGVSSGSTHYSQKSLVVRVEPRRRAIVFYNPVEGGVLGLAETSRGIVVASSSGLYEIGVEFVVEEVHTSTEFREIEAEAATPGLVLAVYRTGLGGSIGERVLEAISTETSDSLWRLSAPPTESIEPSLDGSYVALVSEDNSLYVVGSKSGAVLWTVDGGVESASWSEKALVVARMIRGSSVLEKYSPSGELLSSVNVGSQLILIGSRLLVSREGWIALVDGKAIYGYTPDLKKAFEVKLEEYPWRVEIGRNGFLYAQLSSGILVYDNTGRKIREITPQSTRLEYISGFAVSRESGLVAVTGRAEAGSYRLVVYSGNGEKLWSRSFERSVEPIGWFSGDTLLVYEYPPFCRPSSIIAYSSSGSELFRIKGAGENVFLDSPEDKRVVVLSEEYIAVKTPSESMVLEKSRRIVDATTVLGEGLLELIVSEGGLAKYIGLNYSSGDIVFSVDLGSPRLAALKPSGGAVATLHYYCNPHTYEDWSVLSLVEESGKTWWRKRFDNRPASLDFSSNGEVVVATPSSIEGYNEYNGSLSYTIPLSSVSVEYLDSRGGLTLVVARDLSGDKYRIRVYKSSKLLGEIVEQDPISKLAAENGILVYAVGFSYREGARLVVAKYGEEEGYVEKLWEKKLQNSIIGLDVRRGAVIATLSNGETLVYNASTGRLEEARAPLYAPSPYSSWRAALYWWAGSSLESVALNKPMSSSSLLLARSVGIPSSSDVIHATRIGENILAATSSSIFYARLASNSATMILEGTPLYAEARTIDGGVSIFYGEELVLLKPAGSGAVESSTYELSFTPSYVRGYSASSSYLAVYNYNELVVYAKSRERREYKALDLIQFPGQGGGWIQGASIYEPDKVIAVFTNRAVYIYSLPGLELEARIEAPPEYSVNGGEIRGGVVVARYAKYTRVEYGDHTTLHCTSIAVGLYTYSGGEKALIVFNATGIHKAEWLAPSTYLVALLGGGVYSINTATGKAVKLYGSGEKLLWAVSLENKHYALGVYKRSNKTSVILVSPSGGIEANYTLDNIYVKLLSSSKNKLLLQDQHGIIGVLDTTSGRIEEYQKAPLYSKKALWNGGREVLVVGEDARIIKLQKYSVAAILYRGEPVGLKAITTPASTLFEKSIDKGFKLFISHGDWVFAFTPLEPRELKGVIGKPEWYTRLKHLLHLNTHNYQVYVIYTPTSSDFLSLIGRIVLENRDLGSYECTIAWGPEASKRFILEPGGEVAAKALPGEYRVECTRHAGEVLEAAASVEQEKTTTIVLNCTREAVENKTTTITRTVTEAYTKTVTLASTTIVSSTKTLASTYTITKTETIIVNNTVTETSTSTLIKKTESGGTPSWLIAVALIAGLAAGYYLSGRAKRRRA